MNEGVQSRHEPREMTSGASWYAEWPDTKPRKTISLHK